MPRRREVVSLTLGAGLGLTQLAAAQVASPHAIEIPAWFTESFLDFKDEAAAAAKDGKRLLVYFGQDGCPYCRELMVNAFSQKAIVDKTRANFVAIALNIWGDREVTWTDGRRMSEKEFARFLKVQFTPTLLFMDGEARGVARLNGYQPPQRVSAALDYVAGRMEGRLTLADHLAKLPPDPARPALTDQPFFARPPFDFSKRSGTRPLAILFETRSCQACDEMHDVGFKRAEVQALLAKFDVARFALGDPTELVTPRGRRTTAAAWARELGVAYTPGWVFFDGKGTEVFRVDGYVRPFHLAGSLDYVAGGAYRSEPQFQRFLQHKSEALRAKGQAVELWR